MTTLVTRTIGSAVGRDYPTPVLWEADCPADLVSDDKIWRGECYNDGEFSTTYFVHVVSIAGMTTDATHYVELTAAPDESYLDNTDIRDLPLRYDVSKGVGFVAYSADCVHVQAAYTKISRMQFHLAARPHATPACVNFASGTSSRVDDCLIQSVLGMLNFDAINCTASNVIGVVSDTGGYVGGVSALGVKIHHCTFVRPTTFGAGSGSMGGTPHFNLDCEIFNSAFFGFGATLFTGNDFAKFEYCATDASSSGATSDTGSQFGRTFSAQFETIADVATGDWRVKAGSDLIGAGSASPSGSPTNDITGTAYATPPTVGCWEYTIAGGSLKLLLRLQTEGIFVGSAH